MTPVQASMGSDGLAGAIEIGQRFDAAFGRYKVTRIDGDVIVMIDIANPTACVMPTRDKFGPGLNFWPVVPSTTDGAVALARPGGDASEPAAPAALSTETGNDRPVAPAPPAKPARAKPAPKPKPPPLTSIMGVAFRPRPRGAEICLFMLPLGEHYCGCAECPPACPRSPAFADDRVIRRNPDPPPLTELELAQIWARVGGCLPAAAAAPAAQAEPPTTASDPGASRPAALPLEPAPEPPLAPAPPSDALAAPDEVARPNRTGYPPCLGCGQIRPIMLVLAPRPGHGANDHATLCSRCAQGYRNEEEEREGNRHRFRRFFGRDS